MSIQQGQQFNIVMVDDDSDEADFIIEAIAASDLPLHFTFYSNFSDFLAATKPSALPDLIVMDINLPGRDGIECIKDLKADPVLSYIPIVTFSNTHCQKYEDDSKDAGALQLLIKPTTIAEYHRVTMKFYNICLQHSAQNFEEQAVA